MKHYILSFFFILLTACSSLYAPEKDQQIPTQIIKSTPISDSSHIINTQTDVVQTPEKFPKQDCFLFEDFANVKNYKWGIVNDGVMGGKSRGNANIENNILIFSGTIVTRGGGFSSLRGVLESGVLSDYNSVKLRAKSDGREYRITFRDSQWGNISHRAIIPFQNTGELEEITIPFTDLEPAYFGRTVKADPFEKESAREIGVILSDGVDGKFSLEIDEVRFCR